jgi:hypothetical protein
MIVGYAGIMAQTPPIGSFGRPLSRPKMAGWASYLIPKTT